MPSFVLLHDAFQGRRVWRFLERELRAKGHAVYTSSLTGCGERGHLKISGSSTQAYLDDLETLFRYEGITRAILVCNGYSGMLAPALAGRLPDEIDRIVFLDAVLPLPGKNYLESCPEPTAQLIRDNSRDMEVMPFTSGILRFFEPLAAREDLSAFPLSAFTEPYTGPSADQWPDSIFLHLSGFGSPDALLNKSRAESLGVEWRTVDMRTLPVQARAGGIADFLENLQPIGHSNLSGSCGRNPMPHELRMMYCAKYRRRMEMNALAQNA